MINYGIAILLLPLLSFIIMIFVGKKLPNRGDWLSIGSIAITLCLSLALFSMMLLKYDPYFKVEEIWTWFNLGTLDVKIGILIDNITIIMLLVVSLVSTLVHIYSTAYMKEDPRYSRYFAFLSLFTFSMNGIILSNNLLGIYFFWELVGLSSYLLIGFWFEKESAANASKKAFLVNRVGDIGMFIGIMLFFSTIGSFLFKDLYLGVSKGLFSVDTLTIAGLCLFAGAIGKSAQFPLHIWLPDAMEGPTPVSALIHAATMVAAGVYLAFRLFPIFTPQALTIIAYIGGVTAVFAAIIAITQNDIKKVLAYSTVSQLGYMVLAVGVGAYTYGFFHLVTHAAFKAGLFLCSGSVIHAMHHAYHKIDDHKSDPQDMRNMGGIKDKMPITFYTMLFCTIALSGIPFTSGFLSKDAVLAGTLAFSSQFPNHFLLSLFAFSAALFTAFYMFRLIFMTFYGKPNSKKVFENIHESPIQMTTPLIVLSSLSFFLFFTFPNFNPLAYDGWFMTLVKSKDSLVPGYLNPTAYQIKEEISQAHNLAMLLSLSVAALGIGFAFLTYYSKLISSEIIYNRLRFMYNLSYNKFFIDEILKKYIIDPFLRFSRYIAIFDWDIYDKYFINGIGKITERFSKVVGNLWDYKFLDQKIVDGFGHFTKFSGSKLRLIQSGKIQNYLILVLVGLIIIYVFQAI